MENTNILLIIHANLVVIIVLLVHKMMELHAYLVVETIILKEQFAV